MVASGRRRADAVAGPPDRDVEDSGEGQHQRDAQGDQRVQPAQPLDGVDQQLEQPLVIDPRESAADTETKRIEARQGEVLDHEAAARQMPEEVGRADAEQARRHRQQAKREDREQLSGWRSRRAPRRFGR